MYIHHSKYFHGNQVSEYGLQQGFVDYATLAKSFQHVLNNNVISFAVNHGDFWEVVNGSEYLYYDEHWNLIDEPDGAAHEELVEVFQYYIISDAGYQILSDCTDELVWYHEELDMYVWGVTHWGTSWDYVLTDIRINLEKEG